MRDFSRRIEKVEKTVRSAEKKADERKAKLLEIQKQGNGDSPEALLLKLELEQVCKLTLLDVIEMAQIQHPEDSHRV